MISEKLHIPLDPKSPHAANFLKGGFGQPGYGVPAGAAIDGSFALGNEGTQGYYVTGGKEIFLQGVETYRKFFARHKTKGWPIRLVIKTGIGGQHTPFQGIADAFNQADPDAGLTLGEYELGKNFESSISRQLKDLGAGWDQLAVIPSSKSGSTDETMLIFVQILTSMLQHAVPAGTDGKRFASLVMDVLHDVNFENGQERPGKDLFLVEEKRFGTKSLITLIYERASQADLRLSRNHVKGIFAKVLGHMVFETTPRPAQSRLAAFLQNSGLAAELGEEAPGVVDMFDNVGGRWTGDLHSMAILGFHNLDAAAYWEARRKGIELVRQGTHPSLQLARQILDEKITDIALVVPDVLFWFGKATEQNFNESLWQEGFANLIAVKESQWEHQEKHYQGKKGRLVLRLTQQLGPLPEKNKQALAGYFADLFTTFYGLTHTVGCSLIEQALARGKASASQVDFNNLDLPATKLVQENLFLRQPYVELGKGLLEKAFTLLQSHEREQKGAIDGRLKTILKEARAGRLQTNIFSFCHSRGSQRESMDPRLRGDDNQSIPTTIRTGAELHSLVQKISAYAKSQNRKFVPFLYLEGDKFLTLRNALVEKGVEWVMQGTGDQHISYQQVLAQPKHFLPFIISFVPEAPLPGLPAIGFAKGYLDGVSPHLVRDTFAEKSYLALIDPQSGRGSAGGEGVFLRLIDSPDQIDYLKSAF